LMEKIRGKGNLKNFDGEPLQPNWQEGRSPSKTVAED